MKFWTEVRSGLIEFIKSIYHPASIGVIVEDESDLSDKDEIRFRARNRRIAELVIEYIYPYATDWLSDLQLILSSILPQNMNEVDTVRQLLLRRIGPRGTKQVSETDALKRVFYAALDVGIRDSAFLHHFGLLFQDIEEFDTAKTFLKKTLEVLNDPNERRHFKTESKQNVLNSLGMTNAKQRNVSTILRHFIF